MVDFACGGGSPRCLLREHAVRLEISWPAFQWVMPAMSETSQLPTVTSPTVLCRARAPVPRVRLSLHWGQGGPRVAGSPPCGQSLPRRACRCAAALVFLKHACGPQPNCKDRHCPLPTAQQGHSPW